ncbi:hypothetical protein [Flavobacterium sp.]|uniref:pirin family protein n=1 Tax=Flavobacterium sp. TaxID=239 RepID=UPI00262461C7|nr:hypothetical protein [Flavobacterium sp.]
MEGKIYKADWRNKVEHSDYCCWSTFNTTDNAFGVLHVFNDETLTASATILHQVTADSQILLLPIVGGVDFKSNHQNGFFHINQLQVLHLKKGHSFDISNPYENESVRYFQIQLHSVNDENDFQNDFNLSQRNQLIPIFENEKANVFIGIYDGRTEETHTINQNKNGLFTFIIQGAFEFQNRLLESGDALHLLGIETVEFEALSENAMLLVVEIIISN